MAANPKYPDRCPECGRALFEGSCSEHGEVKGVPDPYLQRNLESGQVI